MTKELEQTLQKILEKSIALAEKTGEFVIDQGSDLLQQFYAWHTAKNIFTVVLGLVLISLSIILLKSTGKKEEFKEFGKPAPKIFGRYYNLDARFLNGFLGGSLTFCGLWLFFTGIYWIMFITIAPKLYLFEYFF